MPTLALRTAPSGLQAGAPRTVLSPVAECASLVADDLAAAEAALPGFVAAAVPAVTAADVLKAEAAIQADYCQCAP